MRRNHTQHWLSTLKWEGGISTACSKISFFSTKSLFCGPLNEKCLYFIDHWPQFIPAYMHLGTWYKVESPINTSAKAVSVGTLLHIHLLFIFLMFLPFYLCYESKGCSGWYIYPRSCILSTTMHISTGCKPIVKSNKWGYIYITSILHFFISLFLLLLIKKKNKTRQIEVKTWKW